MPLQVLNGAPFPTSAGTPVQAGDVLACAPGEYDRLFGYATS